MSSVYDGHFIGERLDFWVLPPESFGFVHHKHKAGLAFPARVGGSCIEQKFKFKGSSSVVTLSPPLFCMSLVFICYSN